MNFKTLKPITKNIQFSKILPITEQYDMTVFTLGIIYKYLVIVFCSIKKKVCLTHISARLFRAENIKYFIWL